MGWGHAAVVVAAFVWGTNHVATRALSEEVPLVALTFWRWAIAVAFMVPIAWRWIRRDAALLRGNARGIVLAGLNGMGVFGLAISAAPYYTTAANVSLISSTTPLWVLLIAALTRIEAITRRQAAGIAIAFAGTAHIVFAGDWTRVATIEFAAGDVIAVAAAILWAIFSFQMKRLPREIHPLATTACCASGKAAASFCSTSPSDTISPAILAKRLARPRMVTKPSSSTFTMSPVSYQPSSGASMTPGFSARR